MHSLLCIVIYFLRLYLAVVYSLQTKREIINYYYTITVGTYLIIIIIIIVPMYTYVIRDGSNYLYNIIVSPITIKPRTANTIVAPPRIQNMAYRYIECSVHTPYVYITGRHITAPSASSHFPVYTVVELIALVVPTHNSRAVGII